MSENIGPYEHAEQHHIVALDCSVACLDEGLWARTLADSAEFVVFNDDVASEAAVTDDTRWVALSCREKLSS